MEQEPYIRLEIFLQALQNLSVPNLYPGPTLDISYNEFLYELLPLSLLIGIVCLLKPARPAPGTAQKCYIVNIISTSTNLGWELLNKYPASSALSGTINSNTCSLQSLREPDLSPIDHRFPFHWLAFFPYPISSISHHSAWDHLLNKVLAHADLSQGLFWKNPD